MTDRSPLELGPSRRSIVRLNRRVIYIVGAVLIIAFVAGLIAIRAQDARTNQSDAERRTTAPPRSQSWFDAVPDQTPAPRPVALDHVAPTHAAPAASPAAPKGPTTDEQEAQRRLRVLRAAMGAPIPVAAFERSGRDHPARRRSESATVTAAPAAAVVSAGQTQAANTLSSTPVSTPTSASREEATTGSLPPEYLHASVRAPASPYEVKAGTIIPAVMLSAVNSDLPGQILGQVRENIYDSDTGEHLLIPQGTRLLGLYDHHIVYGQQRILITWKRLLLPNGSSLSLRDGMPGTDALGAAGFHDQVNNHYIRTFGNALLLSVISAAVQLNRRATLGGSIGRREKSSGPRGASPHAAYGDPLPDVTTVTSRASASSAHGVSRRQPSA